MKLTIIKKVIFAIFVIVLLLFVFSYNNVELSSWREKFAFSRPGFLVNDNQKYTCRDCNVILILIDTLRADHVGAYGYERNTTPNIDQLAREGILFKNMLAQSSWTKPGTASLLTGLYPKNHQATGLEGKLAKELVMLPEVLQEQGYNTSAFVANTAAGNASGFNQGYDRFWEWISPDDYADTVNGELIPFIRNRERKTKQFIYVHYMDPHAPYLPREEVFSVSNQWNASAVNDYFHGAAPGPLSTMSEVLDERKEYFQQMVNLYDDEILFNDKMVGEVVEALKDSGLYENSIVIVVSDHGEEFLEHLGYYHGKTLYEEQLRVPWIMRVPGSKPTVIEKQVGQIDLLPTVLSLLGLEALPAIDGNDVFDPNNGEGHTLSYAELHHRGRNLTSIQSADEKLIVGGFTDQPNQTVLYADNDIAITVSPDEYGIIAPFLVFNKKVAMLIEGYTEVRIPIKLEPKEQWIKLYLGDRTIGVINVFPKGRDGEKSSATGVALASFNLHAQEREGPLQTVIFGLSSSSPCRDDDCSGQEESFQVLMPEIIYAQYAYPKYYSLQEDPSEQDNRYFNAEYQWKRDQLKTALAKYIQERKSDVAPAEAAEFSPEQLEALKALGYI